MSNLGFKASFGRLNIKQLNEDFTADCFQKTGEAFIIYEAPADDTITITDPINRNKDEISIKEYTSKFSQYAIIAKLSNAKKMS